MEYFSGMEKDENEKREIIFEDEDEKRARSFRHEDYNSRRVFLRSYPLHWAEHEVDDDSDEAEATQGMLEISKRGKMTAFKRRVLFVLRWSKGKLIILKKFKNKVSFYIVTCHPFGLKTSPSLITA